jgi:hypothetical protein
VECVRHVEDVTHLNSALGRGEFNVGVGKSLHADARRHAGTVV